jgi:hypothetical protein
MGIWTAFIYNYNSDATIDLAKVSDTTIDFINSKLECNDKINSLSRENGIISVSKLCASFNDTMKIWGYFDEERCTCLRDMAAAMSEITTLVFSTDADNVNYFALRFDPNTQNFTKLMIDDTEVLKSDHDTMVELLMSDMVIWSTYENSQYKKNADACYFKLLIKQPALILSPSTMALAMALNGYS